MYNGCYLKNGQTFVKSLKFSSDLREPSQNFAKTIETKIRKTDQVSSWGVSFQRFYSDSKFDKYDNYFFLKIFSLRQISAWFLSVEDLEISVIDHVLKALKYSFVSKIRFVF